MAEVDPELAVANKSDISKEAAVNFRENVAKVTNQQKESDPNFVPKIKHHCWTVPVILFLENYVKEKWCIK